MENMNVLKRFLQIPAVRERISTTLAAAIAIYAGNETLLKHFLEGLSPREKDNLAREISNFLEMVKNKCLEEVAEVLRREAEEKTFAHLRLAQRLLSEAGMHFAHEFLGEALSSAYMRDWKTEKIEGTVCEDVWERFDSWLLECITAISNILDG